MDPDRALAMQEELPPSFDAGGRCPTDGTGSGLGRRTDSARTAPGAGAVHQAFAGRNPG